MSFGVRTSRSTEKHGLVAIKIDTAFVSSRPVYGMFTIKSTSESLVAVPYAYEPKRMIFCGLNLAAIWSTKAMILR